MSSPGRGVSVTVDGVAEDGRALEGIANVITAHRGRKEPLLEFHVFDFLATYTGAFYVTFKHKLRDEQAFASVELLKQQIDADLLDARRWFAESI